MMSDGIIRDVHRVPSRVEHFPAEMKSLLDDVRVVYDCSLATEIPARFSRLALTLCTASRRRSYAHAVVEPFVTLISSLESEVEAHSAVNQAPSASNTHLYSSALTSVSSPNRSNTALSPFLTPFVCRYRTAPSCVLRLYLVSRYAMLVCGSTISQSPPPGRIVPRSLGPSNCPPSVRVSANHLYPIWSCTFTGSRFGWI
jgi:hypothetical protein